MRTKVTLVLLFLNVALFFYIFQFERQWAVERTAMVRQSNVLGPETAAIQTLEITPAGGTTVALTRRAGDNWFLTKPFEWPANRLAVERIVGDLKLLKHETSWPVKDLAANGKSLASYGLEKPSVMLTYTAGERTYVVALGDRTADGRSYYLLSPDREYVHVVGRSIADSLNQTPAELRLDTLFSIRNFEARSLAITLGSAAVPVRITRESDDRWRFYSPGTAFANRNATVIAINELNALRVHEFVATPPPEATTGAPRRISLEGNNRSETLLLYSPVAPPAASGDIEYYAQMSGKPAYFKVVLLGKLNERLESAQVELRERRVLELDIRTVTKIALGSQSRDLELQRLEGTGAAEPAAWRIARSDAQPLNADTAVVNRLLEQLSQLSARDFSSDAPTPSNLESWGFNVPERTIVLTVPGAAGAQATAIRLNIGVNAARSRAFARVPPSESVYEIDPRILLETPVDPLVYRDRLIRALPAGAQVASIKLTDLAASKVLLEQTSAATQADSPAAAIISQLRVLRAKTFSGASFSPVENRAAPVPAPWKFQLDATIALAGGAGAQTEQVTLFISDRSTGTIQYAGSTAYDVIWTLEQPFIDALWTIFNAPRDPGPTLPAAKE